MPPIENNVFIRIYIGKYIFLFTEYVSDIPKVPMPPIKNKKEDILLKDTVCASILAGIFLPFWSQGQGPVEFWKKSIWTIKVGKT